ncbi:MAG: VOC family protein [Thermoanaerobaculales bacterium]|nr:VOC family protein [Thermoanaerobaculales bacterium]
MNYRKRNYRQTAACGLVLAVAWFASPPVDAAKKTQTVPPGTFLGASLASEDAAGAVEFYSALFGWDSEKTQDGYALNHKGRLVASITQINDSTPNVTESFWLVAFAVNNVKLTMDSARENGATIYRPVTKVQGGNGQYLIVGDNEKAPVMFIEPRDTPIGGTTGPGSWVWAELWSDDINKADAFYANVAGLGHEEFDRGGQPYHVFTSQGERRAGVVKIPPELEDVKPGWAPYVAVADLSASTAKVKELGGTVVFGNLEHPAEGAVALILDPAGAALFLYQIGSHEEAAK